MAPRENKRAHRVAESIRAELMNALLSGVVHDPGAQGVLISNVIVSDDLRIAKIYVRVLDTEVDEAQKRRVLRALERAKGVLRREVGQRVKLKYTPELRLYWDDVVDEAAHIEALLAQVRPDDDEG